MSTAQQENSNNDELISQFMAFTGTSDTDQACSYLEMSGNNVETAVGLFLEHAGSGGGGGDGGGSHHAASGIGGSGGYVDLGNDHDDDVVDMISGNTGSHRGQQQQRRRNANRSSRNTNSSSNNDNNTMMDTGTDGVRAPDQTRTMRLMDFDDTPPQQLRSIAGTNLMLPPNLAAMMGMGMGMEMNNPSYDLMTAMMDEQDLMIQQQQQQQTSLLPSAFASTVTALNARALLDAAITRQDQTAMGSTRATTSSSSQSRAARSRRQQEEKENYDDVEDDNDDIVYDEDEDDEDDDDDNHHRTAIVEPPRLADMFAPPLHLIHRAGGFQGARTMAKDTKRWLLINLQRDAEFACHALNRDVWRDELVENLIREGFIFWQQMDSTSEGRTFSERYQVHDYPHISIIDPRTGRLMWRKEGWTQQNALTADTFAEIAMDFCSRNSFDRPPQAPRVTNAASAASSAATTSTPAKRMHEMSEDELMQAAMEASMSDAAAATTTGSTTATTSDDDAAEIIYVDDDDNDTDEVQIVEDEDSKPRAVATTTTTTQPPREVPLSEELQSFVLSDEPTTTTGGTTVSRIQFRLVDGKRITRKFFSSDPIRAVYAFIAQTTDEARTSGREFVLLVGYPPNDLLKDIDSAIGDMKLNGETIAVRWK